MQAQLRKVAKKNISYDKMLAYERNQFKSFPNQRDTVLKLLNQPMHRGSIKVLLSAVG